MRLHISLGHGLKTLTALNKAKAHDFQSMDQQGLTQGSVL